MFNLSDEKVIEARYRAAVAKVRSHLKAGHKILLAIDNDYVIGGLMYKGDVEVPLGKKIKVYLPEIFGFISAFKGIRLSKAFGTSKLFRLPKAVKKPFYTLEAVGVRSDYQGKGIGKLLLNKLHDILEKDSKASGIYLFTGDKKNQSIYERLGYETVNVNQDKDITVYHMFKERSNLIQR
jgi:GNAT superfamily N-acetyltransferase